MLLLFLLILLRLLLKGAKLGLIVGEGDDGEGVVVGDRDDEVVVGDKDDGIAVGVVVEVVDDGEGDGVVVVCRPSE